MTTFDAVPHDNISLGFVMTSFAVLLSGFFLMVFLLTGCPERLCECF
jgi:hypothetical protein